MPEQVETATIASARAAAIRLKADPDPGRQQRGRAIEGFLIPFFQWVEAERLAGAEPGDQIADTVARVMGNAVEWFATYSSYAPDVAVAAIIHDVAVHAETQLRVRSQRGELQ